MEAFQAFSSLLISASLTPLISAYPTLIYFSWNTVHEISVKLAVISGY
jgi:hypothetical protein